MASFKQINMKNLFMAEQEIRKMMNDVKKPWWKYRVLWAGAAVAVCAVMVICFLASPEQPENDNLLQPTTLNELEPEDTDGSELGNGDFSEADNTDNSGIDASDEFRTEDVDTSGTEETSGHETEPVNRPEAGEESGSGTDASSPEPENADGSEAQNPDSMETQTSDSPEPQNTAEPEPEYIAGPEINTGYPGYDALIAEVQDLLLDYYNLDIYPGHEEGICSYWIELFMTYPERLGYIMRDLDGNGVEELIFGEGEWHGVVYHIYTIVDGEVIHVANGGSRSRYYLCENGCIAHEGSSSAFETEYSYYTYKGTELTLIEAVIYDFEKQLYSTKYPYYLEEYPPEVYQDITDEEIDEVMAKYVYEEPQFTPFVELLPTE